MRIDKFLKNSRIVKRRTISKEACQAGKVLLNGKTAKPGSEVAVEDIIEITFGQKTLKIMVKELEENFSKEKAADMYIVM